MAPSCAHTHLQQWKTLAGNEKLFLLLPSSERVNERSDVRPLHPPIPFNPTDDRSPYRSVRGSLLFRDSNHDPLLSYRSKPNLSSLSSSYSSNTQYSRILVTSYRENETVLYFVPISISTCIIFLINLKARATELPPKYPEGKEAIFPDFRPSLPRLASQHFLLPLPLGKKGV